ncbi:MAG TPA: hypothetical protein VFB67_08400 [Candidatus Polarisedimenticolaceae bacterium]|nr:hypothetical protein [Candidatus Polarisedimenticolaceae bacterium]
MTAKPRRRFDVREESGKILLVLGALLLVNAAASVLIVRPKVVRHHELTDQSSPQAKLVRDREREVLAKEKYREALERARDDMKRLAQDVLSTRQRRMIAVQLEIAKLVREFGIAFDRVQYENESVDNGALERFAIVVPLAGGYTSLRKFIQAVESSDNFLIIERVALGTGKSTDVVELNITLATYFIAPDADVDAIGKKPGAAARRS